MSYAPLALALALGSIPLAALATRPAPTTPNPPPVVAIDDERPNIGDCRPDIGGAGGGQMMVYPETVSSTLYQALLITTETASGNQMYVRNGTVDASGALNEALLEFNTPYFLRITYTAGVATATILERDGSVLMANFPSIANGAELDPNSRTRFVVNETEGGVNVFDKSGLLQVYHDDFLTTVYLYQRP